jgi:multiple sugar transport system substrate-binding protein
LRFLCFENVGNYAVPYTCAVRPNHVWRPPVEKAGYTMEDVPKTWDAYYDFFKEVQKKLRAQGTRNGTALSNQPGRRASSARGKS